MDIILLQIIWSREPDLVRSAAANPYLVLFPHPEFQVWHLRRRNIHGNNGATQRRIRRGPGLSASPDHFCMDPCGQFAMPFFDLFYANPVAKIDGCLQSRENWDIRRANVLESLSFQLRLVPTVCGNCVPQLAHDGFIFLVEKAGALWRL